MRALARRSIQTINNRTQVVSSFVDSDTTTEFVVRRLSERTAPNRQLFIVTLNNGITEDEVIPFAEIATSSTSKLRYVVNPANQYPELADPITLSKIEKSILVYMKSARHMNFH